MSLIKALIRNIAIYTLILYVLPILIPGVTIDGGFLTFLIGGIALALMFLIIKPILSIVSLPVNFLTLGLFSLFINALILYIATIFISNFSIGAFNYPGGTFSGFVIPKLEFNTFFAYVYTAMVASFINGVIQWIRK
jgi:putative membrane protein